MWIVVAKAVGAAVRLGGIEVTEAHGGAGTARIAANPKSSSFTPLGYRDYELVTPARLPHYRPL
jgi:hypothetical protein